MSFKIELPLTFPADAVKLFVLHSLDFGSRAKTESQA